MELLPRRCSICLQDKVAFRLTCSCTLNHGLCDGCTTSNYIDERDLDAMARFGWKRLGNPHDHVLSVNVERGEFKTLFALFAARRENGFQDYVRAAMDYDRLDAVRVHKVKKTSMPIVSLVLMALLGAVLPTPPGTEIYWPLSWILAPFYNFWVWILGSRETAIFLCNHEYLAASVMTLLLFYTILRYVRPESDEAT